MDRRRTATEWEDELRKRVAERIGDERNPFKKAFKTKEVSKLVADELAAENSKFDDLKPEEKFELTIDGFERSLPFVARAATTTANQASNLGKIARGVPYVQAALMAKEAYDLATHPQGYKASLQEFKDRNEKLKSSGYNAVPSRIGLSLSNPLHTTAALGEDLGDGLYEAYKSFHPEEESSVIRGVREQAKKNELEDVREEGLRRLDKDSNKYADSLEEAYRDIVDYTDDPKKFFKKPPVNPR